MKKIKLKKIVYPAISAVFFAGTAVVFVYAAKFLSTAVNKAFFVDEKTVESRLVKLNLADFYPAADKLGIQTNKTNPESKIDNQPSVPAAGEAAAAPSVLDKSSVKIEILNSVKKAGLAAELKSVLETDGFTVEKTGNVSPALATTAVKIKESKKDYGPLIKNAISGKYPRFAEEKLEENEVYDIIIVIGGE